MGGILSQGRIGKDKPIAHASRSSSDTEKKYDTNENETLAIIFYVLQPRKLVFPLQLRVKQCCIFRYRGIQCRN